MEPNERKLLEKCLELFRGPRTFCRNRVAETAAGGYIDPRSPLAVRWCIVGAMDKFQPECGGARVGTTLSLVCHRLYETYDYVTVNNQRGKAAVVRVLREALRT